MNRVFAFLSALVVVTSGAVAAEKAPVTVSELPVSVARGATGASIARAPDGQLWLSWIEAAGSGHALRFATFDAAAGKWSSPGTVASGPNWFVNWADFPSLSVDLQGRVVAVWFVNNPAPVAPAEHDHHGPGYRAMLSSSNDHGRFWSAPAPLTRESDSVEFVSLATLADGRVLATWLDGRGKKSGGNVQQLFARVLGDSAPDTLVDASVCDCCQTTLTAFPDGGALLAYRGRTTKEVRDMQVARFDGHNWNTPRPLSNDDWRINACPVNGPQLDNDRGRVAAVWFTAADNEPRVLASYSPDAGARFLMPLRIDRGQPAGRVDTVILRDGAMLVTWLEKDGSLWLRRISPDFAADEPTQLASAAAGRAGGFPRTALVRDYAGGRSTAQFVVAYARGEDPATLRTLLVTVPEGDLLSQKKDCDCAPTPEQLAGLPFRGTVTTVLGETKTLRLKHEEIPGVLAAGTHEFRAPPEVISAVAAGRQFFGRAEQRENVWWVFDVRLALASN